jgi:argininosuccinate lyase
LTLADFETESDQITEDVYAVLTLEGSVAARSHLGGTAPDTVRAAIARAKHQLG